MIEIYGSSDDIVCHNGNGEWDEIGCYDEDVLLRIGDKKGGLYVEMSYGKGQGATWTAKVEQIDEGVPIPWDVSISHNMRGEEVGYSVRMKIDCPEGTPFDHVNARSEDA